MHSNGRSVAGAGERHLRVWSSQNARNHSPSERGRVTSAPPAAGCTPGGGVPGGYKIHFLRPTMAAFHAFVAFGSTWKTDPERRGPMMSHL